MGKFFREGTSMWANGCESAVAAVINTPLVSPDQAGQPNCRGIMVGGAGNLIVTMADGSIVTLVIPATACGFFIPISILQINTSTTATGVIAFF